MNKCNRNSFIPCVKPPINKFSISIMENSAQISPVQRLPNEVVEMILSYFNPVELTKIELVCRKWYEVSRSRQTLWRDALCGYRLIELSKRNDQFLYTLLERGGRKLTDLAIEIDMSKCDLNGIRRFCKVLEASEIRNLWLEISPGFSENLSAKQGRVLLNRYVASLTSIFASIGNCSHLQSLHIEASGIHRERLPPGLNDQPIANCKLERLSLKN